MHTFSLFTISSHDFPELRPPPPGRDAQPGHRTSFAFRRWCFVTRIALNDFSDVSTIEAPQKSSFASRTSTIELSACDVPENSKS